MDVHDPSQLPQNGSDLPAQGASVPVLQYGQAGDEALQIGWGIAIALSLLQVFWIAAFLYPPLGWDRPKSLGKDSLYFVLQALPSFVGAAVSVWRLRRNGPRTGGRVPMIVCLCLSLALAAWVVYMWVLNLLLDPHGRWYPL